MPSSQRIIVTGHLAKDPELTYTPSGTAIAKFSIPVQEYYDKKKDRTNWFSCVAIDKRAENISQYLAAGDLVQLDLKKSDSSWMGKDGKKQYKTEFFVVDVMFLRVKYFEEEREPEESEGVGLPEPDDDIPF
jgi:single-strand DNA-binding protein